MGHLQDNGYTVDVKQVDATDLAAIKAEHGVPGELQGCHTAIVDGYVIEGHVPADLMARLLDERPDLVGLAVPGMPVGSPGMAGPNPQPYNVMAFDSQGRAAVYAER